MGQLGQRTEQGRSLTLLVLETARPKVDDLDGALCWVLEEDVLRD